MNALALSRATRGKGIIISSSARSAFELRGPYDVINTATLFGLSEQDAKVCIQSVCTGVLARRWCFALRCSILQASYCKAYE